MRWSGFLPTPNMAALEVASLALVVLWAIVWLRTRCAPGRVQLIAASAGVLLVGAALVGIAATGSRAGSLAFVAGLAVLACSRLLSWRWMAAILAALVVLLVAMPHAARFAPLAGDGSIHGRFNVWQAAMAVIADHPWRGVGLYELPQVLDCWYLPAQSKGRVITVLNEPLTIAVAWGLPAMALAMGMLAWLAWSLIRAAAAGRSLAGLGLALLAAHLVSGQFQGHLFMEWWWARASWLMVLAIALAGCWRHLRWSDTWRIAAPAGAAVLGLVLLLAHLWGDAAWRTHRLDGQLLAEPRHRESTGLTIAVTALGVERRRQLAPWIAQRHAEGRSLILTSEVPPAAWWRTLPRAPLVVADGDVAVVLWQAWRQGIPGPAATIVLTDPADAPEPLPLVAAESRGPMRILLGRAGSHVLMRYVIEDRLVGDGGDPSCLVRPPTLHTSWHDHWALVEGH